jgi:hypothetical protein
MTTQPDFRALCAELERECFELYSDMTANMDFNDGYMERMNELRDRARAALNTPPIAPIPMSERLPGPEALKGGYCWFWLPEDEVWFWERPDSQFITDYGEDGSWLPHWAIPLPEEPE